MRRILRRQFRRSTLWLMLFFGILAGLGLARKITYCHPFYVWAALWSLSVCMRQRSAFTLCMAVIFGLSLGLWRGGVYMQKLDGYKVVYYQKVTLTAVANEDAVYGKTKQLAFTAGEVALLGGQRLVGSVQLSGYGANAVYQGDEVAATGKLYPGYGSYQGKMSFAQLEVVSRHPSLINEIRRRFVAGAQTALPEPLASFVMGLLVGQRANLPQPVKDDLKAVGLTHIIAVSGANLTIIIQAVRRFLSPLSKRMSTLLSLLLIGVFLLLTGASASIVRAAIVSILSICTAYYGRSFKPLNLIMLAAVITAMANPVYIWSDLGWYLSFLAFYGVMLLAPLVQARWPSRWHQTVLGGVALESLCTEVMTLPFILYIFGQMSRVGLLANVLVVSLVPLAMLLGLIAGLAGMLISNFAGWFAWPAVLLLNYMLDVAHFLADLPGVFVEGMSLSLLEMLVAYVCIAGLTSVLWFKNSHKSTIITDMTERKMRGLLA